MKYILLSLSIILSSVTFSQTDIKDASNKAQDWFNKATGSKGGGSFTQEQAVEALKTALDKGIKKAVAQGSKTNGFYGNAIIKIPFPQEAAAVKSLAKKVGMQKQVDQFVVQLNRAAEQASKEATPIFMDAIKKLSINKGIEIVKGPDNAATKFLDQNTRTQLTAAFRPEVKKVLDQTHLTQYYKPLADAYNKANRWVRFGKTIDPDLEQYVLDRTLDGLFTLLANEEKAIRQDPMGQAEKILQQVFGGK